MNRFFACFITAFAAVIINGCTDLPDPDPRIAEPGLTWEHARARAARISGVIYDFAQLEQAVSHAETLHPLLRKHLLDMRFDVRRCLAIGAASGSVM